MRKHPTMVNRAKDYLEHRRALGFALDISGELLLQFARFADDSGHRGPLTTELVLRWAALPEKASPRYRAGRLAIVRPFARYMDCRCLTPLCSTRSVACAPNWDGVAMVCCCLIPASMTSGTASRVDGSCSGTSKEWMSITPFRLLRPIWDTAKSPTRTGISRGQLSCFRRPVNVSKNSQGSSLPALPEKRFEQSLVEYLTKEQMQSLLDAPDTSSRIGRRDCVLLMLMYNTGARVSEIADLRVGDLRPESGGSVHFHGKGRKQRSVPLWRKTVQLLRKWLEETASSADKPLLPNSRGGFMTRAGVAQRLSQAVATAAAQNPTLRKSHISPHTIRHTTAMHLLQSGVDLSTIAMWLGHESIQTTHQYLEADLESKRKALASVKRPRPSQSRRTASKPLMQFLENL